MNKKAFSYVSLVILISIIIVISLGYVCLKNNILKGPTIKITNEKINENKTSTTSIIKDLEYKYLYSGLLNNKEGILYCILACNK